MEFRCTAPCCSPLRARRLRSGPLPLCGRRWACRAAERATAPFAATAAPWRLPSQFLQPLQQVGQYRGQHPAIGWPGSSFTEQLIGSCSDSNRGWSPRGRAAGCVGLGGHGRQRFFFGGPPTAGPVAGRRSRLRESKRHFRAVQRCLRDAAGDGWCRLAGSQKAS